ncbi:MAG: hypothetical protein ACOCVT_00465 [bacterium]
MLHVVVLLLLIFVSPVREVVFTREKSTEPEIITRGDELEEIIDAIRDRTAERLKERVALLEEGQSRMATNFRILNEHFQPFEDQQKATAAIRLEKYIQDVLRRQQQLVDLTEKAAKQDEVMPAVEAAREEMSRILQGQEEILRGIQLLEINTEEMKDLQNQALDAQIDANQHHRWLDEAVLMLEKNLAQIEMSESILKDIRGQLEQAREMLAYHEKEQAKYNTAHNELREKIKSKEAEIRKYPGRIRNANNQIQNGKRKLKAAEEQLERNPDADRWLRQKREAEEKIKEYTGQPEKLEKEKAALEAELEKMQQELKEVETKRSNHNRSAGQFKGQIRDLERSVEHEETRLAKAKENVEKAKERREKFKVSAHNIQSGAYYQQKEIIDNIREFLKNLMPDANKAEGEQS